MASNWIRNTAYVLHILSALAWASLPFLDLLQDTGLVAHASVQYWAMFLVLGLGLPALIVMLLAVMLSFLVRPPDLALWLVAILLVAFCVGAALQILQGNTLNVVGGL